MLLSYNWLKDYLPKSISISKEEILSKVSDSLAEVENITETGKELKKVIVGQIVDLRKHPNSEKLQVASVKINSNETKEIVCGAFNIFKGAKVPVILPENNAYNPDNGKIITIKQKNIKGVLSDGMLASQKELGLSDDHIGIWILSEETEIGLDIAPFLKDLIIEIENKSLTHRSDCFSYRGIAREFCAIFNQNPTIKKIEPKITQVTELPLEIDVQAKEFCKRYSAVVLKDIEIKSSPVWMQIRLLRSGIRPINNIVDATNYIMLDIGQPLHAFDYDKISDKKIIVRLAKTNEETVTLDGKNRKLTKNSLIIASKKEPIGIAGIMGSVNSEIDNKTKRIVIESANFEMYNIRKSERELGLRTEASIRFEKGLDPELTIEALNEAIQLISDLSGAEIASKIIDDYPEPVSKKVIDFYIPLVKSKLGIDISKEEIIKILKLLNLEVIDANASNTWIKIVIPTYRRDLTIKEDILEEIARIFGYEKFIPTIPTRSISPQKRNEEIEFIKKTKLMMSALGFDEIYSYSFVGQNAYKKTLLNIDDCLKVKNPLSDDLAYLKNTNLVNLIEKASQNYLNAKKISIFEICRVFDKKKDSENKSLQPKKISGLISEYQDNKENYLFLKGKLDELFKKNLIDEIEISYKKTQDFPFLEKSIQAEIFLGKDLLGIIGNLNNLVKINWDFNSPISVFEIDLNILKLHSKDSKPYSVISEFPTIKRDISFWISKQFETQQLTKKIGLTKFNFLIKNKIVDIFDERNQDEKKSITIEVEFQSNEKTLTDLDIKDDLNKIISIIESFGGEIRR